MLRLQIILEYLQYMGYLDTAKSLSLALQTPLSSREDDILKRQGFNKPCYF